MKYVALLRGINVGGNNVIKMVDLRAKFEALGYRDVSTYIQSGNVVFSATGSAVAITRTIEAGLQEAFGYEAKVVLVSARDLALAVAEAPKGFGSRPATYRYDVLFVKPPLTTQAALEQVSTNPGVDEVSAGTHALYFRRLIAKASQSRLAKLVSRPVYKNLTIRNWATTTKLLAICGGAS